MRKRSARSALGLKTHPIELGAAVTTLGCSRELFDVVIAEVTAGSLDNAPSRRCGVIRLAFAEGDTLGHCCKLEIWVAMRLSGVNWGIELGIRGWPISSLFAPECLSPTDHRVTLFTRATRCTCPRGLSIGNDRPHTLSSKKAGKQTRIR